MSKGMKDFQTLKLGFSWTKQTNKQNIQRIYFLLIQRKWKSVSSHRLKVETVIITAIYYHYYHNIIQCYSSHSNWLLNHHSFFGKYLCITSSVKLPLGDGIHCHRTDHKQYFLEYLLLIKLFLLIADNYSNRTFTYLLSHLICTLTHNYLVKTVLVKPTLTMYSESPS